ncbi:MAG: rod shape-determining protein MreC [Pseudomonadota bacterium]|nr:MAG: rod shape-determining protein MreC [Pseudomonadota bacterium]
MNSPGHPWPPGFDAETAGRVGRLMFYGLLAIVLMALDFRGGYVDRLHRYGLLAVEPAFMLIDAPFVLARRLGDELRERDALLRQIDALEQEQRQRRAALALLDELARENAELRALLDASERVELQFKAAELMSVDLNPWSHRVLINRGSRDGLAAGMAVMDGQGVIGQIDDVARHAAQVILISDPDHALPVRVRRTGLRTVAYGSGRVGRLRLTDLPMNVDLEPDDVVVTSGLGGIFPAGLPVARVDRVERPPGEAFARADLQPLGRLDRARHLLVVMPQDSTPETETGPAGPDPAGAATAADQGP